MSLGKLFKTNAKAEREGVFFDYGPNEDLVPKDGGEAPTMRFRLARAGGANLGYVKALERITRPFKKAIQTDNLSNDRAKALDRQAFIEACLLGWENITLENEVLGFSKENAEKLFTALPELYDDLRSQAGNFALYRDEQREADLGNSGGS